MEALAQSEKPLQHEDNVGGDLKTKSLKKDRDSYEENDFSNEFKRLNNFIWRSPR